MPKMSHAIEGWSEHSTLSTTATLAPSGRNASVRQPHPTGVPDQPGLWKYERVTRSPLAMGLGILLSLGLHVFVLLGFNHRPPPVRPVLVDDGPLIQMTMPDLQDEEEKPVESLDTDAVETPAIAVPMLVDVPTIVPVNAFVQPLDFTPALTVDPSSVRLSAVPVNIARGSGTAEKIGKIFDVSQLDRQPQAILQPPPIFPADLRREYPECTVVVGFIITAKGEVAAPYIISSQVRRFEEAALTGVMKWKFRPGYRGGRPVNTRTQIAIYFRVGDEA